MTCLMNNLNVVAFMLHLTDRSSVASSVDGLSCGAYQHGFDSFYLCHHKIPCKIFTSDAPNMVETIKGKDRQ